MDLFEYMREQQKETEAPLASRLRPTTLDEMVGQQHLLAPGKVLRRIIESGEIPNLIFYGPSGVGKTTLAGIIASQTRRRLHKLNCTTAGLSDIRDVVGEVDTLAAPNGILLYLDETVALNSPVKVIYQLMYIAFMLLFTAQTGLLLGKGAIFPRYVFCLIAAAVLAGSVSISALLCAVAGVQGHTLSPAQILFSLAGSIYALCQLFSAASAAAQWTEEEKKEA